MEYLDIWQKIARIGETSEKRLKRSQKRMEISKPLADLPK